MISSPLVPAIIPTSVAHLQTELSRLGSVPELHLDVVDGLFVPYTSWPYSEGDDVQSVKAILAGYTLEVDLMVAEPLPAAKAWVLAGADRLVFHVETISPETFIQFTQTTAITVGISANNDTPFEMLESYLAVADFVQVMGIAQIGAQGLPFDERALTRLAQLQELYPRLSLSLDGGVNSSTLPTLLPLKLERYIIGSAIMSTLDPHTVYLEFSKQARSHQQG